MKDIKVAPVIIAVISAFIITMLYIMHLTGTSQELMARFKGEREFIKPITEVDKPIAISINQQKIDINIK